MLGIDSWVEIDRSGPAIPEGTLPDSTVADVHDSEASTVPLCRELVAVEGVCLFDSTLVRVKGATGGMDPQEHFLPISGLRKGHVIASVEQNEQGGFQLGWGTVVWVLAFELRDPQMLVVTNGVTMTAGKKSSLKSKEEKNKQNWSNEQAHRGQSVRYRLWWKQGNIKIAVSEDHASFMHAGFTKISLSQPNKFRLC